MNTGPSTPARDKGKGIAMSPQQQALQASHATMQRDAGGADRYYIFLNLPASSAASTAKLALLSEIRVMRQQPHDGILAMTAFTNVGETLC